MNPIQQAARLYEARDTLQVFHAAEYHARLSPWVEGIKKVMAARGEDSPLSIAIEMGTKIRLDETLTSTAQGMRLLHVLAAAVEIMEPSEAFA